MRNSKQLASMIAGGIASPEQLAEAGQDFVYAVKSDGHVSQMRMHAAPAVQKGDDDGRTLSFVASTEARDSYGDIIRVRGWDLGRYKKNPIILFQHNSDWPIGTARVYKGELSGGKKALFSDVTFASAEASPMAEQVYQLAKAKVLRGNSVGFYPKQTRIPKDDKEREELGLGEFGVIFEKSELIEDSVVSVPSNPEAVQLGLRDLVSRSLLTQDQADLFAHDAMGAEPADWFGNARRSLFDFSEIGDQLRSVFADAEAEESVEPEAEAPDERDADEEHIEVIKGSEPGYTWTFEATSCGETAFDPGAFPFTLSPLPSAQGESGLVTALTALVSTQAEQLAATRALADTVNDLARKVLELGAASRDAGAPTEAGGDEEFDMRSVQDALRRLTEALPSS